MEDHRGPTWQRAEEVLKKRRTLSAEIQRCEDCILELERNSGNVDGWISILQNAGFLTTDHTLTEKGTLASEFNEGHSLLCSEFVSRGFHKELTAEELVTTLACFMESSEKNDDPSLDELKVPKPVYSALCKIGDLTGEFQNLEDKARMCSPSRYWSLSTTWIEPIWRWLHDELPAAICNEYGLFEGNFVRAVLRVANMVDECVAVCTFVGDVETLEKLNGIRQVLIRDILIPDSLYLHL
jgi:superfamily II RNA helicase